MRPIQAFLLFFLFFTGIVLSAPSSPGSKRCEGIDCNREGIEARGVIIPKPPVVPKPPPSKPPGSSKPPASEPLGSEPPIVPKPLCKKAEVGGCNGGTEHTGITQPPGYDMSKTNIWGKDRKTVWGWVDWKPRTADVKANSLQFEMNLQEFAQRMYHDMAIRRPVAFNDENSMVAALYVPDKGVMIGTNPRSRNAAEDMVKDIQEAAPALWKASKESRGRPDQLHAEDNVIYSFEKHIGLGGAEKFPPGSRIAVYGKTKREDAEQSLWPCRSYNERASCQEALGKLDIKIVRHDIPRPDEFFSSSPP